MKTFIPHVYFSAPEDTVDDLVNQIRRESEIPGTAEPKPEMKDSGKKSIIPKTVVSAAKSELDRVYDLLTSGEDLQMNPDGTLSPASAPKKRAKPAPGSEPKAPVKAKKEIIPHTVVSAPEKDTVGDLIEQLHKEPEPLPEEPPEEKAETPEKTDGKKSIIPKTIVSAPVQQWYKTNKALYNAEIAAMRKEFNDPNMQPHFMSDGRMYWLVKTRPNLGRGFNTMTYTMKLVYDPDHPKVRYSSSVKPYLVSPTLGELQKIVNMLPHIPLDADGKKLIPHTLTDNRGERYICSSDVADVHAEDTCTTSAVTSFRFAYRWLMVFELAIRKPEAWKDFQAHGKI
ncbi:hypothetical protein [Hominenteromicrobium sp.]|uniref:hypothetical protein n=1 Tax=Hominenteromicrobium sp. TaxID=3073581 RepID=UPI003A945100